MAIKYSDREVERFHPICQQSLQMALSLTGKADTYRIEHHKNAGGLEMDFAITNRNSGKVMCVVEVKRTPSAVKSSRYQYQAMSYIQQLPPTQIERPYYVITNIECSCMFKYDASRPNVHQQMLTPGLVDNVKFMAVEDDRELTRLTAEHFAKLLTTAFNDSGRYLGGFDAIVAMLADAALHDSDSWPGLVARFAYEYIRGAMDGVKRDTGLCDIRQYDQNTAALGRAMAHIDFAGIFAAGQCGHPPKLRPGTLADAYALGRANIDADEIVSAVHQIVSEGFEGDGEVPTDIELGRLMTVVARHFMPELHGKACDPAAGSGNLLSCLCDVYPGIGPSQIKANDKKPALLQLLTLRLGLKFPMLITPDNAPSVSACSIDTLPCSYFSDVCLIMLNPPMVASISCGGERRQLYDRIRAFGKEPVTDAGQPPLESAFMELINTMAVDGTVTVALLPRTHLTAQGPAAVALRRFLLNDFGLSLIFNYPGIGLFENVTKDTVMVVGIKGARPAPITLMYTMDTVADTDLAAVAEMLNSDCDERCGGLECLHKSREEMEADIHTGWNTNDSLAIEIAGFAGRHLDHHPAITSLNRLGANIYRGKVGNKGLSDMLFLSPDREPYRSLKPQYAALLPWGMRNAKSDCAELTEGDSLFLDARILPHSIVSGIIDRHISSAPRQGRQRRDYKSREAVEEILYEEAQNSCRENSVLLPRDLRRYGRVYRCAHEMYVSTNFFVIEGLGEVESRLLASWMTTVFFQLSCELFGKNQEGTRKMERGELFRTHIPNMDKIGSNAKETIAAAWPPPGFIDLQKPEVQTTDELGAKTVFGKHWNKMLAEASDLLLRTATLRHK